MDLELTDEQRMIQDVARDFAEKELRPIAGIIGVMGICVPEAWGGSGGDAVGYTVAVEEVSRGCASHGVIMSVNNSLYCAPVWERGTDEQKRRFLAPFASGAKLGCFSLTEPEAGSDATNQHTRAEREGEIYVLNGRKIFVTNGREAHAALVFAQTDPDRAHHGISAFLVEKGTPGFTVVKTEEKLGIRASDTAEFLFENCRVPVADRLGDEGEGFKIALGSLDGGRIGIAAQAVGIATEALEAAIDYAKLRRAFGKPIADFQAIRFYLADMATELDAARLLTRPGVTGPSRNGPPNTSGPCFHSARRSFPANRWAGSTKSAPENSRRQPGNGPSKRNVTDPSFPSTADSRS